MESKSAVTALTALAQETRLAIFRALVQTGPSGLAAGASANAVKVAPATLSFHLKELTHADLIVARQDGRFIFYSANYAAMSALLAFMTEHCCAQEGVECGPRGCAPPAQTSKPTPATPRTTRRRRGSSKPSD